MERTHSGGPWTARAHTWTPSGRSSRGFLTPTWGHHTASLADPVRWIEDPPTPVPRMDSNDPGQPVKMCRRRRRPRHGLHTHAHRGPSPLAPAPGPFATGLCSDGRGQAAQPSCLPRSPHLLVRFPKAPHSQQPRGLTSQLLPPSRASREETPPPKYRFSPPRSMSPGEAVSNRRGRERPHRCFRVSHTSPSLTLGRPRRAHDKSPQRREGLNHLIGPERQ